MNEILISYKDKQLNQNWDCALTKMIFKNDQGKEFFTYELIKN